MGLTGCSGTSVNTDKYAMHNVPERRRSKKQTLPKICFKSDITMFCINNGSFLHKTYLSYPSVSSSYYRSFQLFRFPLNSCFHTSIISAPFRTVICSDQFLKCNHTDYRLVPKITDRYEATSFSVSLQV